MSLRPLGLPSPLRVREDGSGLPAAVEERGGWRRVEQVREVWRIDDEWWRAPVSRLYVSVVLDGGRPRTLYRDLAEGGWWEQ